MEWQAVAEVVQGIFGSDDKTIIFYQMSARAVIVFLYLLFLIRVGSKRVFGKNTSFDIVVGVMLGSILGRALTANARFIPTLVASAVLIGLHMLVAKISFHSHRFGFIVKGTEDKLIDSGKILRDALRRTSITEHDLKEGLRTHGGVMEVEQVKAAFLERNGEISVIKKG